MKGRAFTLIVSGVVFSFFAVAPCLAGGDAPAKAPVKESGAIVVAGKSVPATEKAANSVQGIVEIRNAIETAVTTTVTNVDGKKIVDITIPQGKELVITESIYADVINIHGDGSIIFKDSANMGVLPQLGIIGGDKIGSSAQTSVSYGTIQAIIGSISITPNEPLAVITGHMPDGALNNCLGADGTLKATVVKTKENELTANRSVALNKPKGTPRMGPNVGHQIITQDNSSKKEDIVLLKKLR